MIRPDFDGLLIREDGQNEAFLVFAGRRHRLGSADVSDALFVEPSIKTMEVQAIEEGHPLHKGTCLVRDDRGGSIYLLTICGDTAKRHLIKDWESFLEFGFALEKVVELPRPVLDLVPPGPEVSGAMARVGRW